MHPTWDSWWNFLLRPRPFIWTWVAVFYNYFLSILIGCAIKVNNGDWVALILSRKLPEKYETIVPLSIKTEVLRKCFHLQVYENVFIKLQFLRQMIKYLWYIIKNRHFVCFDWTVIQSRDFFFVCCFVGSGELSLSRSPSSATDIVVDVSLICWPSRPSSVCCKESSFIIFLGCIFFFFQKKKQKKRSLFPVDNCMVKNGVTIKDLSRLKTNTLVSATVSSGTGQLGINYLIV